MAIKPLYGKIHVRVDSKEKKVNGLVLIDKKYSDQKSAVAAEILAVGDGVYDVGVGDIVLIPGYAGDADQSNSRYGVSNPNEELRVIYESEVMAIVTPKSIKPKALSRSYL